MNATSRLQAPAALATLATVAVLSAATSAIAQSWPAKPIRLIVPFAPGGGNDIVARTMNIRLPALLGQPVVIENRPGAGGNLGAEMAARAAPDGYTLLIANNSLTANLSLYRKLPYDPFRDFAPISLGATSPNMILARPALPAKTVKDLIALARARPGAITFGSPGAGTPSHLAGELFMSRAKVKLIHVPYKGAGPLVVDQMAGHVTISFTAPIVSKPFIDAGKMRPIAVTSEKRWAGGPDIPTVAESGFPGFDVIAWFAYFAPAATPREIIDRVAADIGRAANSPEVKERFTLQGIEVSPGTPEELAAFIKRDFQAMDALIKDLKIVLD
ncbi:MAG: tripartite tricarboxylate transporter substrate binding protein [Proteobacteria bacterium]|nr:tripartite tricarboxylate transporter substrate binding protein [Pseudomonadota bacterium]